MSTVKVSKQGNAMPGALVVRPAFVSSGDNFAPSILLDRTKSSSSIIGHHNVVRMPGALVVRPALSPAETNLSSILFDNTKVVQVLLDIIILLECRSDDQRSRVDALHQKRGSFGETAIPLPFRRFFALTINH
jgi:hypothetical protein